MECQLLLQNIYDLFPYELIWCSWLILGVMFGFDLNENIETTSILVESPDLGEMACYRLMFDAIL